MRISDWSSDVCSSDLKVIVPASNPATIVPTVRPEVMPAPTKPDAVPRSLGAKRSATTVVSAACIELSAITAPTTKRVIAHRLVICGTAHRQRPTTSDTVTIHGARRTLRVRVRARKTAQWGTQGAKSEY